MSGKATLQIPVAVVNLIISIPLLLIAKILAIYVYLWKLKPSPFGYGNYTPVVESEQRHTFLECPYRGGYFFIDTITFFLY